MFLGRRIFFPGNFFFVSLPGLRWLAKHVVFFFGFRYVSNKYIHISSGNKKTTSVNKEIYNPWSATEATEARSCEKMIPTRCIGVVKSSMIEVLGNKTLSVVPLSRQLVLIRPPFCCNPLLFI